MTLKTAVWRVAFALALGLWIAADAAAVQVTLNLVQSQSHLTLNGSYAGYEFAAQDDPEFFTTFDPGNTITDYDPSQFSNRTNLVGTITVDVDNPLAPTTIQIVSANMDAQATGEWLPEPYFDGDYNDEGANNIDVDAADYVLGRKTPNDFGGDPAWYNNWRQQYGEPDGGAPTDDDAGPALPADIGIKIIADFGIPGCCDAAYASLRDVNYNFATQTIGNGGGTPVVESVNAQGEFSSQTQFLSYRTGWFDYWIEPLSGNDTDRDNYAGEGAPNQYEVDQTTEPDDTYTPIANAPKSTYVVSGGIATLTIPIDINVIDDITQFVDGQLVATINLAGSGGSGEVPEPTGAVFVVVAGCAALLLGRRRSTR
jgi:hypothetical protein